MSGEAAAGAKVGERRQFIGFVLTGGIAAGVNLGSRWLLSLALPYALAVSLAYLVGMLTAFVLARVYVFRPEGKAWAAQLGRFALVNVGSYLVVLGVSLGLARVVLPAMGWTWHAEDVAHLVGVASPIVLSYFAHKRFSFGQAKGDG